jgi:hypothetical protein
MKIYRSVFLVIALCIGSLSSALAAPLNPGTYIDQKGRRLIVDEYSRVSLPDNRVAYGRTSFEYNFPHYLKPDGSADGRGWFTTKGYLDTSCGEFTVVIYANPHPSGKVIDISTNFPSQLACDSRPYGRGGWIIWRGSFTKR